MKHFSTAPLPFMGQKRRFLKALKPILNEYPDDATYVDLFGGSGLLSHFIKSQKPKAKVIYNDFDNYTARLANVGKTNELLAKIRVIIGDWPKDKRITGKVRDDIMTVVAEYDSEGFVDYITLSSSLLFSARYVTSFAGLRKESLYNVVKMNDYNADGYLQGVDCVRVDYRELYNRYKSDGNAVFMVDPPYLNTEVGVYQNRWKLADYLDVLQVLGNHKYLYFTSNKSNILELCEWIGKQSVTANPFYGADIKTIKVQMNHVSSYTDMMLYKTYNSSST